ncbi:flavin monoamine oxidase family protein [Arthrobacter sp. NyZ413]|uniref:flavin monoamine oxidase family protein n=1 Tax=Arthrobacter sp. NyZ413 TaxID=3144669 RepID=UPI003BF8B9EA
MTDYDVIVIGAGFAGSLAARDLSLSGSRVLHLEARDRIGGRTWYKEFADTGHSVEFGGTWVCPDVQPHVKAVNDRYGLELVDSPMPQSFGYVLNNEMSASPFPIPMTEWCDFERALTYIDTNAARIRFGEEPLGQEGLDDLDVSFEEFFDRKSWPVYTREFILAWASFYFGAKPSEVSALHILSWVAGFENSAVGFFTGVSQKYAHGTKQAIEAITGESRAELRLQTVVTEIDHEADSVTVRTRAGEKFTARAVIVATPINTWSDIEFDPKLEGAYSEMAKEKQTGESTKIWALVGNQETPFYGVGSSTRIKWLATEYQIPQGNLMCGFGCEEAALDVEDSDAVAAAVKELLPSADVIAVDAHAWNRDEFANGTWMAYRPGQVMAYSRGLQEPVGRLVFAGSDLASGWAGWMDGALESGDRAAKYVQTLLTSELEVKPA